MSHLKDIFNPQNVAVIGASEAEGSISRAILGNLLASFKGNIFPVNPGRKTVLGLTCYPSITAIEPPVDLAVIAVKAPLVPDIIEGCGKAGVKGALIISTGFGEASEAGRQMEVTMLEAGRKYGTRIIGPGSIGIIRPGIGLNTSFLQVKPRPGNIGFILQKGELGDATLEWGVEAGIGFSIFASLGSRIDVDFGDMIDLLGDDYPTRSILINMERIYNTRKFMSAARGFARKKPIIILKPGKFRESVEAEISGTGGPPGDDEVYDAAFKRVGVVRVESVKDLFNAAQVLDSNALPSGPRLAILGNAGTVGIIAADVLIEAGGMPARLSGETVAELLPALSPPWNGKNPIDLGGDADMTKYAAAVSACLDDPASDALLVIHTRHAEAYPVDLANLRSVIPNKKRKPVLATLMGGQEMKDGIKILQENNIPAYGTPEEAVRTYLQMYRYKRNLELLYETPAELPVDQAPPKYYLKTLVSRATSEGNWALSPEEAMSFLANYHIPTGTIPAEVSMNRIEEAANNMGFPVVISGAPSGLYEETMRQQIEVRSPEMIDQAITHLKKAIAETPEGSYRNTAMVRPLLKDIDYKVYLAMRRDRDFRAVIRFGTGGIGRDIFRDCAIGLPPLNQLLARRLIEESKAYTILSGYRGYKPFDLTQLELIMINFSNLIVDFPEIASIDVDPIVISDQKILALDARIYLDRNAVQAGAHSHLVITPYPTRYTTPWGLKDGTEVLLRPVRPEDEPMLLDLFKGLSDQTMIERFFSPIKDMTHEMLVRFCNIDYDREIAIVAYLKEGESGRIIGISDIIIDQNMQSQFAVLVHDEYQGKGLGRKLIDTLIGIAQERGISTINGVVLTENTRMLKLLRRLGFKTSHGSFGTTDVAFKLR